MNNRALLIGVKDYPGDRNDLQSCIADTLAVERLLQDYYDFSKDDIRILHDEQATLAHTLNGLDWLFADAAAGDHLVFYESSHGYRYPQDETMVEVLCLYDGFLEDKELSRRTQALPPGVLTVILDACHSGGMSKVFFPNGQVQVARVKVFQPDPEQAEQDTRGIQAVTQFKFFAHSPSGDPRVVAKAFAADLGVPVAKEGSDLELNGLLFAACRADQTALDGSPATNGLSAFTFGLLESHYRGIGSIELQNRTEQQLRGLHIIDQTPLLEAPAQQPDLVLRSFITAQELREDSQTMTQIEQSGDLATIAKQIAEEMKSHSGHKNFLAEPGDPQYGIEQSGDLATIAKQIAEEMKSHNGHKNLVTEVSRDPLYWEDLINCVTLLTPTLAQVSASKKGFHKAPATETFALTDPSHLQDKSWWNDFYKVLQHFVPAVVSTLSEGKGFQAQAGLTGVRPEYMQNKVWWNDVLNIVTQMTPYIANALNSSKDFKTGSTAPDAPSIIISREHINDKGWMSDAFETALKLAPFIIEQLLSA
jgi:hypothetical protein